MPILPGECKGGHAMVGIYLPTGTPIYGGPLDGQTIENGRFLQDGCSGIMLMEDKKSGVYHPWPCDDNTTTKSLHYISKGNL